MGACNLKMWRRLAKNTTSTLLTPTHGRLWYPSVEKAGELPKQSGEIGEYANDCVRERTHESQRKSESNGEFLEWLTDPILKRAEEQSSIFGCMEPISQMASRARNQLQSWLLVSISTRKQSEQLRIDAWTIILKLKWKNSAKWF